MISYGTKIKVFLNEHIHPRVIRDEGPEHLQNCDSCGVFTVCSGQYLPKQGQTRKDCDPVTGSYKGWPMWSNPIDELL